MSTGTRTASDGFEYPSKFLDDLDALKATPWGLFWWGLPRQLPSGQWVKWHCSMPYRIRVAEHWRDYRAEAAAAKLNREPGETE